MTETSNVRPGEELNIQSLSDYLRSQLPENSAQLEISQFPAGSSNLTYLIKIGNEEYVLRRPPFGNQVKTAHDMNREFQVLSKLSKVYAPAPRPLLFCDDESVIGSEFYLMERRRGLIIRGKAPQELIDSPELQKRVCESFIDNLAALHSLDYSAAGLSELGHPEGYNRRQVEGWTKRYFNAKTDEWPELESAIEWLNKNIPSESGAALIHNDYKFDNVMLAPDDLTKIMAVLDWEMVTIGDPLMDLGTTLGYWMSGEVPKEMRKMPFNPKVLMENISRHELARRYAEKSGRDISNLLFYYVFGTFKIAVIAQQIYARYKKGFTRDERFAGFGGFVNALGKIAVNALKKQSIL
ncbi:MAG TPA: phosphotransferase family protein [Pyrinomonadaceae bacterium]|jgi:aminoglycoside phosphotransferase (APT) family kinase protein|nr:phosphotransferase family protein [Pyrinomonadaceae bacterium]